MLLLLGERLYGSLNSCAEMNCPLLQQYLGRLAASRTLSMHHPSDSLRNQGQAINHFKVSHAFLAMWLHANRRYPRHLSAKQLIPAMSLTVVVGQVSSSFLKPPRWQPLLPGRPAAHLESPSPTAHQCPSRSRARVRTPAVPPSPTLPPRLPVSCAGRGHRDAPPRTDGHRHDKQPRARRNLPASSKRGAQRAGAAGSSAVRMRAG